MKIRVTFHDPDRMPDLVARAYDHSPIPDGLDAVEWESVKADRVRLVQADIAARWMRDSDYLTVEFDTKDHTAVVIPNKDAE